MSRFAIVPTHWLENEELEPSDRMVLVALSSFADQQGYCWPSIASIARRARFSERTVQYSLKRLLDLGAISVEERVRKEGGQASNAYWLMGFDTLPGVQPVQGGVQPLHRGGAAIAPGGVQPLHPNSTNKNSTTEQPTTTTTTALDFGDPDQQQVYEQYRRAHHNPTAFDATLRGLTQAMGGPAYPLEQVGAALLELAANNEGFNLSRLRGYLRGLGRHKQGKLGQTEEERHARMLAIMEETLAARGIA